MGSPNKTPSNQYLIMVASTMIRELKIKLPAKTNQARLLTFVETWQGPLLERITSQRGRILSPETKGRIIKCSLGQNETDETTHPHRVTQRHHISLKEPVNLALAKGNDVLNHLVLQTLLATIWDILSEEN